MANTVDKVLAVASAEVGYLEKSASAYIKNKKIIYDKTAGAGKDNYTKYGYEMHNVYPAIMDFPAYWCDCFVDWCFMKAYGVAAAKKLLRGDFDDYTVASKALYVSKDAYKKSPKVGDQIFFTNGARVCHTGLVYKIDHSKVYTIEGNTSGGNGVIANGGGVAKKSYALGDPRIDGYGRPKYDKEETKKGYSGEFPSIPPVLKLKERGVQVARLQLFLNWYGEYNLKTDSDFGDLTEKAVKDFQKREGLTIDGQFGKKSLEAAKNVKK